MNSENNSQKKSFAKEETKWFKFVFLSLPLKFWWSNRKYFKRPKVKFDVYRQKWRWNARIFDFECEDLGWKTKYSDFRHETNPYISINIFNRITFYFEFVQIGKDELGFKNDISLEYWEWMLNYAYNENCKFDLLKSLKFNGAWSRTSKIWEDTKYFIPYHIDSLTKKGKMMLAKQV
jgi:hypothetical protein